MIQSACCYGTMSAGLSVDADTDKRIITVKVRSSGLEGVPKSAEFPADQFGAAIDLYNEICAKMKKEYSRKEMSA